MSVMNESTRRAFLAALGASGVTAAVLPGAAGAQVGEAGTPGTGAGTDTAASASTPLRTEAFPAPTPGTNYKFMIGGEFQPTTQGAAAQTPYNKGFGEIEIDGIYYRTLSDLPPGARITEVTFAVLKSATYTGSSSCFAYQMTSGTLDQIDVRSTAALGQLVAEQYVSLVVDPTDVRWIVDNQQASTLWLVLALSNGRVNSVRVGWVPGPTTPLSFFPIAPKRAYDSRFVAPLGPLLNNTNRVISVANSYLTGTGTLETSNIIPVGAQAIAYNITIANTVTSGFLSVNPGDAATPGGSSINWFTSGLSLANGLVVKLDASRQIKVFCGGGGSTDFIIDILGYYA